MSGTIFISYRRGEDAGAAGRLYDRLEHTFGSQRLFMDVDNIQPGEDFVTVLEMQVAACDVLLAVIGRGWLTATDRNSNRRLDNPGDFVRIEIGAALAQRKRVIPVLVDAATMPSATALPNELRDLPRRQAVRIAHERFREDAERLARALEKLLVEIETHRQAEEVESRRAEAEARRQTEKAERWRAEVEARRKVEEAKRRKAEAVTSERKQITFRVSGKRWLTPAVIAICIALFVVHVSIRETTNCAATSGTEKAACLRKAADQGNATAQVSLGWMYYSGQGVPQDAAEAVKWYRKAADQGDATGQYNLGVMYANGRGVPSDAAEAVKWYRKAADQGNATAQNNLGLMYDNGRGVPQDDAEAMKWYRKAADQGNATAQNNLGVMYDNGQGVPQDAVEAVKWYRKAADQGNAVAQNNLGVMYANGRGVPQDAAEAVKWYRKAADQGNAAGQYSLGWMYANGQGVPQKAYSVASGAISILSVAA